MIGALGNNSTGLYSPDSIKLSSGRVIDENSSVAKNMKRSGQLKCETCAERKYKDGSDENVSFKAATHISPQAAASAVRAHEQEHVTNAYDKAAKDNGRVISANVAIKTSVCPECGKSYVSGGLTTTQIKYDKSNPYAASKGALIDDAAKGNNIDYSV